MNKFTSSSSTLFKLSDTLPCLMEDKCEIQTVELEYDQAKLQLDGHMQYTHIAMEENTGRPRPYLAAQSLPALAWLHTWLQPALPLLWVTMPPSATEEEPSQEGCRLHWPALTPTMGLPLSALSSMFPITQFILSLSLSICRHQNKK